MAVVSNQRANVWSGLVWSWCLDSKLPLPKRHAPPSGVATAQFLCLLLKMRDLTADPAWVDWYQTKAMGFRRLNHQASQALILDR